jgi:chromate transporter
LTGAFRLYVVAKILAIEVLLIAALVGPVLPGVPGAIAGWLAMITPAGLIIPLVHFVGRRMGVPRIRSVLETVVVAIAMISLGLLYATKIDTHWIISGAAVTSLTASRVGLIALVS